jgi:hypothetical protein
MGKPKFGPDAAGALPKMGLLCMKFGLNGYWLEMEFADMRGGGMLKGTVSRLPPIFRPDERRES